MWLSRNNFSASDFVHASDLNNLANDNITWGGDVNGGGYHLSNVILQGSGGFTSYVSPVEVTPGSAGTTCLQLDQTVGANHVARWTVCKDATVETGSNNTGSNFAIGRYTDAGAIIDTPIAINRSTGLITMGAQQWAGAVNGGGQTLSNVVLSGLTISGYVPTTTQVIAGPGLAGGGALSANVTLSAPVMAASGVSHAAGLAPDPGATAGTTRYLREDATWAAPPGAGGGTANYWVNGALVGTQPTLNLIAGTNVTVAGVNNTGSNRVDVTITSTGSTGGSPQTPWASDINAAGFRLLNAGNIGIGTSAPANRIAIVADAQNYAAIAQTTLSITDTDAAAGGANGGRLLRIINRRNSGAISQNLSTTDGVNYNLDATSSYGLWASFNNQNFSISFVPPGTSPQAMTIPILSAIPTGIGIGIAAPAAPLVVAAGSVSGQILQRWDTTFTGTGRKNWGVAREARAVGDWILRYSSADNGAPDTDAIYVLPQGSGQSLVALGLPPTGGPQATLQVSGYSNTRVRATGYTAGFEFDAADSGGTQRLWSLVQQGQSATDPRLVVNSPLGSIIFIRKEGWLGVGTDPVAPLHVRAAANEHLYVQQAGAVVGAVCLNAVNDANSANVPLEIRSSATVFSVGAVAIGVSSPGPEQFYVLSASQSPSLSAWRGVALVAGSVQVGLEIGSNGGSPYAVWLQTRHLSAATQYPLSLNPLGAPVGIGNQAPAYSLDVTGDVNCTGAFRVNGAPLVSGGVTTGGPVSGKVVGTTYTNSNSTPLYLSVTLNVGNAVIGTLTIAGSTVAQGMCVNGGYVNLFGIALPGQTYVASGGAVQAWAEWH